MFQEFQSRGYSCLPASPPGNLRVTQATLDSGSTSLTQTPDRWEFNVTFKLFTVFKNKNFFNIYYVKKHYYYLFSCSFFFFLSFSLWVICIILDEHIFLTSSIFQVGVFFFRFLIYFSSSYSTSTILLCYSTPLPLDK
jgi:hypothetical protein